MVINVTSTQCNTTDQTPSHYWTRPDPQNNKITQLSVGSNDKWFNGCDPFEILHILSNADDKAVAPSFLCKPPEKRLIQCIG
jgi:hypothetical protein